VVSETESLMLRILERIQADVADVKVELRDLRADMEAGFAALIRQNDRRFLDHEGRIRVLEKDVRVLKSEVRLGFRAMQVGFAKIDGRFVKVDQKFEARFHKIDERLAHIDGRLSHQR
jgi:hypothetical protein